jgi:FkbM family methyltransferase
MNLAKTRAKLSRALAPVISAKCAHGTVKVRCMTTKAASLAQEFYAIEPETLAWIDSLPNGDRLWDIGANIGLVSIYAAKAGLNVVAFEPGAQNYAALNDAVWLNGLGDRIGAYCVALSDKTGAGSFHMGDPGAGGALHAFGAPENQNGAFVPKFSQSMLGITMDDAVSLFGLPEPQHIKLDVDSIEDKILAGARKTLSSVRSVLIEIESNRPADWRERVYASMAAAGLKPRSEDRNVLFVRA